MKSEGHQSGKPEWRREASWPSQRIIPAEPRFTSSMASGEAPAPSEKAPGHCVHSIDPSTATTGTVASAINRPWLRTMPWVTSIGQAGCPVAGAPSEVC
jgi:hypothetical protein